MIKETKLGGFSAIPLDYEAPDGDLSTALGVVSENGALCPILQPKTVMKFSKPSLKVVHIHDTTVSHYYIVHDTDTGDVYCIDKEQESASELHLIHSFGATKIYNFATIGNTLLVLTEQGMHYFLWKNVNDRYLYLGTHLPEVLVSFGLVGHPRLFSLSDDSKETFSIEFDGISEDAIYNEFSENNQTRITSQIMAKVNKFVAQESTNKGRFCFPFFVRYALRLYDGSLVHHSSPILMNPSTMAAPVVMWNRIKGKKSYSEAICDIMLVAATLDYKVVRNNDSYNLDDWTDIIKGIDVFISKPIYTYDQSGKISSLSDTNNYTSKFIGRLFATNKNPEYAPTDRMEDRLIGSFSSKEFLDYYCEWSYSRIYTMYYSSDRTYPSMTFHLPEFSEGKVKETIENTSTFYKLCSIEITDAIANNNRKDIVIDDEYLQSLLNREVMTDDYLSHDQLYADYSFTYNSRLNLSGLRRKPFEGFWAQSMFAYCNGRYDWRTMGSKIVISMTSFATDEYSISVYIKENGKDYVVQCPKGEQGAFGLQLFNSAEMTTTDSSGNQKTVMSKHSWGCYVFYPNTNAYKMVIYNYNQACYVIDLKAHEFLNGAFAILDYELVREKNFTSLSSVDRELGNDYSISVPNKIYTSEVNNPFYFPITGINTVGTGTILGICAAVKALSQGQFGQFPLYAFSTDGVWALEVSSTGSYSAKQPVTREVCINSKSITQMDSAVLFATNRGIMLIQGSTATCITDSINNQVSLSLPDLPHIDKVQALYKSLLSELHGALLDSVSIIVPFISYLADCRMVFDYTHQRIILYHTSHAYAYVYSLQSQQWGMMLCNLADTINSYPDALAMDGDGNLVNFSETEATSGASLLLTRPFKLDDPNILKTIDTLIVRGTFRNGHVHTILYASNNLFDWHLVASSVDQYIRGITGTPYKYFRLALVCNLQKGESVYSFTTQYTPRFSNRPR